ncbi:MAG: hypothetical protein GY778_31270 [bacterium]|nr:hypothetical protein [bacterium]
MPAEHLATLTFDTDPNDWPLTEPIVRRGAVATFLSQIDGDGGDDPEFLATLSLGECWYGAASCRVFPFVCELPDAANPPTARDIVRAVKAKHFRSQHIASLDTTYIPFPGYHPGTENDEVHNDFQEQHVFCSEDGIGEFDGAHGALKHYVVDGRLWYVLLHTTPKPHGEFMFSEYVILFVLGKSPRAARCVGVVTHQVCHNLCD